MLCMQWREAAVRVDTGLPKTVRVGRGGMADMRGSARLGTAKGLTLTERRLPFGFSETTPRPEGQAFRRLCVADGVGLDSLFPSHQGERKGKAAWHRFALLAVRREAARGEGWLF